MTEAEKEVVRARVRQDNEKLMTALAPLYLGKKCWNNLEKECIGPECVGFLPTGEGNKITGGGCAAILAASQIGPIADGLVQLAMSNRAAPGTDPGLPRVITSGPPIR